MFGLVRKKRLRKLERKYQQLANTQLIISVPNGMRSKLHPILRIDFKSLMLSVQLGQPKDGEILGAGVEMPDGRKMFTPVEVESIRVLVPK